MDADMLAEELTAGKALSYATPEKALAAMQERLKYLQERRDSVLKQPDSESRTRRVVQLESELSDTRGRIKEYEAQIQGRN